MVGIGKEVAFASVSDSQRARVRVFGTGSLGTKDISQQFAVAHMFNY